MHSRNLRCWRVLFLVLFLTYSLPISYVGCKALYIVINFLVLWPIYLSSSFINFKNFPEYLTRWTTQVFILLMRFLQQRRFSYFFLSSLLVWWYPLPILQSIRHFSFLSAFWFFPDLVVLFFLLFFVFHFIMSIANFSIPNSIPSSWQHILIVYIRVSNSFSFWASSWILSMYINFFLPLSKMAACLQVISLEDTHGTTIKDKRPRRNRNTMPSNIDHTFSCVAPTMQNRGASALTSTRRRLLFSWSSFMILLLLLLLLFYSLRLFHSSFNR